MAKTYEQAGVNLEAGYEVVRRIKKHVASTSRTGVMGNIGAFGGMFDLSALKVEEPVLVSGTDGVGTKLKLAFAMDKHDTIGIDAVAMCVNDVLAQGAEPLLFLDYVAVGRNEPHKIEAIVSGVAEGCRQAGCALVGGETAEMPGMYAEGEYDIAGFTCGVVEKKTAHRRTEGQGGRRAGGHRVERRALQRLQPGPQDRGRHRAGPARGLPRAGRPSAGRGAADPPPEST